MKKLKQLSKLMTLILILFSVAVSAQVPRTISFQGVLRNGIGDPVQDGNYQVEFRIFDDQNDGTEVWFESQNISTVGGLYNVILGSTNPISGFEFNKQYWLEVTVDSNVLSPRIAFSSVPSAMTAGGVVGSSNVFPGSGYLGVGTTTPDYQIEVSSQDVSSNISATTYRTTDNFNAGQFSGRAARGTEPSPAAIMAFDAISAFSARGHNGIEFTLGAPDGRAAFYAEENWNSTSKGTFFSLSTTGLGTTSIVERLRITADGKVGIGNSSPSEQLEVSGTIAATSFKYDNPQVRTLTVGPEDFIAVNSGNWTLQTDGSAAYSTPGNNDGVIAPIKLPEGSVISEIRLIILDNSAQDDLIELVNINCYTQTRSVIDFTTTSGEDMSNYREFVLSPNHTIITNGVTNHIRIVVNDSLHRFYGAVITYSVQGI